MVTRCAASAMQIAVAPIHDRMPVIPPASAYDRWLDAVEPVSDLQSLLKPCPADEMAAYAISAYVNSPKNQGPKCIEPVWVMDPCVPVRRAWHLSENLPPLGMRDPDCL